MMKCTVVLKGFCHDPESRGLRLKRPGINTYVAVRLFLGKGVTRNALVTAAERVKSDHIAAI